jgi:phage-related tail fiber protein
VSRTTFAELFSAIGTTHGAGDGSTTFNVPDLRGEFVRGWDHGRGVDSGRGLGSLQAQDWKSFYMQNAGPGAYNHGPLQITKTIYPTMNGNVFGGAWSAPAGMIAFGWDSSEIRPRNRALMGCIKF